MPEARRTAIDELRRTCSPESLGIASTAEIENLDGVPVGQARANEAITFGLEGTAKGLNIFATGPVGVGKRTTLERRLREYAHGRADPSDWVYLHNFAEPRQPIAVRLDNGDAQRMAADMRSFLEDARGELTAAFESQMYAERRRQVTEPVEAEHEAALEQLREQAKQGGIAVELTPAGIATVPLRGLHPISPSDFSQLPETVRKRYQDAIDDLAPSIQAFLTKMRSLQSDARRRLRELDREVALFAVGHLIDDLKADYAKYERVVDWLSKVSDDVVDNRGRFLATGEQAGAGGTTSPMAALAAAGVMAGLEHYEVNVFVSHELDGGAPVVIESNPTYPNLFGRIEHQGLLGGGFVTDHRMLRPGAIHRANGGYLMLPAAQVLGQPLIWLKLKQVLRTGSIRLENPAEEYALLPSTALTPEEVGLDLKVVLVGSPVLYELAYRLDEDVRSLFRVKAEFDWSMPWDEAGEHGYATFLASQADVNGLRHFDSGAVSRVIEHGARLAENQRRLSTQFVNIAELAAEADHYAAQRGGEVISAEDVERAIEQKMRRSNLIERRLLDMVRERTLTLSFDGRQVGQINGLAVLELGDYSFGRPARITASASPGRGAVLSIDRESELSGPIHDKGFLTLTGYLRRRYGEERRIALTATITFEQSYDQIDGDSASSAELYTLLSELADVPLRQDIAVTGSVNQHGELQAIGGVNEKIEGFFRACSLDGLTGDQGVLIPEANVRSLMLSLEVVQSVEQGRFHVWSASTVDEAMELLTGIPTGERDEDGRFPEGSLHARIDQCLERWVGLAEAESDKD